MMKKICFWLLLLSFVIMVPVFAEVSVTDMYMAEDVDNRRPVNVGTAFPAALERVYCFTRVNGMAVDVGSGEGKTVYHVWYMKKDGVFQEMAKIPLVIRSRSWRTRSSKKILGNHVGEWKVDIKDENETVLASIPFQITP